MEWILNVLAGLVTSAIVAIVGYALTLFRNRRLEATFKKSLAPKSVSFHGNKKVGVPIANPTIHSITIRDVAIRGGSNGKSTIHLSLDKEASPKGTLANDRGWVDLPPKTEATWVMRPAHPDSSGLHGMLKNFMPLKEFIIVLEYKTLFGSSNITEVRPHPFHEQHILSSFTAAIQGELPSGL